MRSRSAPCPVEWRAAVPRRGCPPRTCRRGGARTPPSAAAPTRRAGCCASSSRTASSRDSGPVVLRGPPLPRARPQAAPAILASHARTRRLRALARPDGRTSRAAVPTIPGGAPQRRWERGAPPCERAFPVLQQTARARRDRSVRATAEAQAPARARGRRRAQRLRGSERPRGHVEPCRHVHPRHRTDREHQGPSPEDQQRRAFMETRVPTLRWRQGRRGEDAVLPSERQPQRGFAHHRAWRGHLHKISTRHGVNGHAGRPHRQNPAASLRLTEQGRIEPESRGPDRAPMHLLPGP